MIPLIALAAALWAAPARAQEAGFPAEPRQQPQMESREAGSTDSQYVPPDGMGSRADAGHNDHCGPEAGAPPCSGGRAAEGRRQAAPPPSADDAAPAKQDAATAQAEETKSTAWHPEWREGPEPEAIAPARGQASAQPVGKPEEKAAQTAAAKPAEKLPAPGPDAALDEMLLDWAGLYPYRPL